MKSNERTTLTKSLHTVTVVSRVADRTGLLSHEAAVRQALKDLGMPSDWPATDKTFAACVAALAKLRS